jgi:Uncharacterised nucleotidyltransferase
MNNKTPLPLSRKDKKVLVSLLLGNQELSSFEELDLMPTAYFIMESGLDAHLLWRLSHLPKHSDFQSTVLGKLQAFLTSRCEYNAARNLQMDANCRQVCTIMHEAGIDVMLLKGAALRARYGELAGRPQSDTDIMVRFEDLDEADQILREAGYVLDEEELTREQTLAEHFNFCMIKGDDVIELHWAMSIDCSKEVVAKSWERAERIDWHGVPVWVPSIPDQLVFTQVHICRSAFYVRSLRMYGDMIFELERWPDLASQLGPARADWPQRMVFGPVKVLADFGFLPDSQATEFLDKQNSLSARLDYWLLGSVAQAAMFNENWNGLPMYWFQKPLFRWLRGKSDNLLWTLGMALRRRLLDGLRKAR